VCGVASEEQAPTAIRRGDPVLQPDLGGPADGLDGAPKARVVKQISEFLVGDSEN
jgi:hypothetical protein